MVELRFEDPMVFDRYELDNGIHIFHKPDSRARSTVIRLAIPLGFHHTHNFEFNGAVHFFEHITLSASSSKYGHYEFFNAVQRAGGEINARVSKYFTSFDLRLLRTQTKLQRDFIRQIFFPRFKESEIDHERKIIRAERGEHSKWAPFTSKEMWFINTQWLNRRPLSIDTRLGTEEDIQNISIECLQTVHAEFFTPHMLVIVTGGDITPLKEELEALPVHPSSLSTAEEHLEWNSSPALEVQFPDTLPSLLFGGFIPAPPQGMTNEVVMKAKLLNFLISRIIFTEYRQKRGLIYSHDNPSSETTSKGRVMLFELGFHSSTNLSYVSEEIFDRIEYYLSCEEFVHQCIDEQLLRIQMDNEWNHVKHANFAIGSLKAFGRIISEQEDLNIIQSCKDIHNVLLPIWRTFRQHSNRLHIYPEED